MPDSSRPRLTLASAMLLVAAMAPGLVLLRNAAGLGLFTIDTTAKSSPGREFIEHLSVAGGCVLFPLTLAVLALSLRDRRSTRREVLQGAGFVACLAVFIAAILPVAYFVVGVATAPESDRPNQVTLNFNNSFGRLKQGAGPMIVGAWLALALSGRWRLGPSWVDRLGCLIGVCFIAMYVHGELYFLLLPLLFR